MYEEGENDDLALIAHEYRPVLQKLIDEREAVEELLEKLPRVLYGLRH